MLEHILENWLEMPNNVLLFLLRSLRISRLKILAPGRAEDTMVETMTPRFAVPEP